MQAITVAHAASVERCFGEAGRAHRSQCAMIAERCLVDRKRSVKESPCTWSSAVSKTV